MIFSFSGIRYFTVVVTILLCTVTSAQSRGLSDILQQVEKNTPALKAALADFEIPRGYSLSYEGEI